MCLRRLDKLLNRLWQAIARQFIRHSHTLLTLVVLDFLLGGTIVWFTEQGRLSVARAYYEHLFAFFGNQPSVFTQWTSKAYAVLDALMGILVIPSLIGLLLDRVAPLLSTEDRLETLLVALGRSRGLEDHAAKHLAEETIRELRKQTQKLHE